MSSREIAELKTTLRDHEERLRKLEERVRTGGPELPEEVGVITGIRRLAGKAGVDTECVRGIFDVEGNQLTVTRFSGQDNKGLSQDITLLTLVGYKFLLGQIQVLSKEIRRNVGENGVPIDNFSTYLNEIIPSFIRKKGKPRSPKTTYRLTPLGEAKCREIIKALCEAWNV